MRTKHSQKLNSSTFLIVSIAGLLKSLQSAPYGKKTCLIFYNPMLVADKMRNRLLPACNMTLPSNRILINKISKSIKHIHKFIFNQLANMPIPKEF